MLDKKNILITGGTGMIGRSLIDLLSDIYPESYLYTASLDSVGVEGIDHVKKDLTVAQNCREICDGADFIFHLCGIKGSPMMAMKKPASFSVPMILFNTNMMEAARKAKIQWYLYTSSVGVYAPAEVFYEDSVWDTFPSKHDWFAGWAKRIGELQAKAYEIEYEMKNVSIVRPANVFGKYDNFNPKTAMVIPTLIARLFNGESPLTVWGDGSAQRDFIYSDEVARAMLFVVLNRITDPVNAGSGKAITIKEVVKYIVDSYKELTGKEVDIEWDKSKPSGDKLRLMSMDRMKSHGWCCDGKIFDHIYETMKWYQTYNKKVEGRYDVFSSE